MELDVFCENDLIKISISLLIENRIEIIFTKKLKILKYGGLIEFVREGIFWSSIRWQKFIDAIKNNTFAQYDFYNHEEFDGIIYDNTSNMLEFHSSSLHGTVPSIFYFEVTYYNRTAILNKFLMIKEFVDIEQRYNAYINSN